MMMKLVTAAICNSIVFFLSLKKFKSLLKIPGPGGTLTTRDREVNSFI